MADVSALNNKKRSYEILQSNLQNIVSKLDKAIDYLKEPITNMSKAYLINSSAADKSRINNVIENLKNIRSNIKNIVLSNINYKINNIQQDIYNAEEE